MINFQEIKKSFLVSVWFMFLTFPIMVIRVNTIEDIVEWRWVNLWMVGIGSFVLSFVWRFMIRRKEAGAKQAETGEEAEKSIIQRLMQDRRISIPGLVAVGIFVAVFPFAFSMYQTNIMTTALIYVMLGLGLNIVVGLAGLLDLGYVAFYAVGAYSYALLNHHFGLGFWAALPIGAGLGALFGILLGFPVLRLRGDYLAIVTLGFGEIIRLILENWNEFSFGPSGIANIPRPSLFGMGFSLQNATTYFYFLMIGLTLFTIFVGGRLGATWAGMAGVMFAAKTTFINPASFTIWESIIILCVVVLGGMGSIVGVIFGALVLILLPEYLRAFSEYRMLIFGAVLVIMMVFRPGGIVTSVRRVYEFKGEIGAGEKA